MGCQVKLKSTRANASAWLPSKLIGNQKLNYRNYKLDIESYYGFETITLDSDGVEITGLTTDLLNSSTSSLARGTAEITYGGQTLRHEYSVWFTEGPDQSLNGKYTVENDTVSVENFKIMRSHGADGYLKFKGQSIPITRWAYGDNLDLYSNGKFVAEYSYETKIIYILGDTFDLNYEVSVNVS